MARIPPTIDRRTLLIGAPCALAVPLGAAARVGADPAVVAYARAVAAEAAFFACADDGHAEYEALDAALAAADRRLEQVRAAGPDGVKAKLARLATRCAWEPERVLRTHGLVRSVVADVALLAGLAGPAGVR